MKNRTDFRKSVHVCKRTLLELNFINHIQVHEENEFCHCLFKSLVISTGSRAVDGKEIVQKGVMHVQSCCSALFLVAAAS